MRCFFFSSRRRHTRSLCDWSSDVCSSDLLGESDHDGRSLLSADGGQPQTALEIAAAFLEARLGDGERHSAADVIADAAAAGIVEHTPKRARRKIGAKSEKIGFGGSGGWVWWLASPKGRRTATV